MPNSFAGVEPHASFTAMHPPPPAAEPPGAAAGGLRQRNPTRGAGPNGCPAYRPARAAHGDSAARTDGNGAAAHGNARPAHRSADAGAANPNRGASNDDDAI
jgi:hypothetical protein